MSTAEVSSIEIRWTERDWRGQPVDLIDNDVRLGWRHILRRNHVPRETESTFEATMIESIQSPRVCYEQADNGKWAYYTCGFIDLGKPALVTIVGRFEDRWTVFTAYLVTDVEDKILTSPCVEIDQRASADSPVCGEPLKEIRMWDTQPRRDPRRWR